MRDWGVTLARIFHGLFQQKQTHRKVHLLYRGRQAQGLNWGGHLLQWMWELFPLQLLTWQLPDVSSNYIHWQLHPRGLNRRGDDCSVGEWIFQGNRRLSTLVLGQSCPWWSLNPQRQSPLFQDFKMKNWLSRRRFFDKNMFISLNSYRIMQKYLIPVISSKYFFH